MSGGTGRRTISREMAADTLVIEVVVRVVFGIGIGIGVGIAHSA